MKHLILALVVCLACGPVRAGIIDGPADTGRLRVVPDSSTNTVEVTPGDSGTVWTYTGAAGAGSKRFNLPAQVSVLDLGLQYGFAVTSTNTVTIYAGVNSLDEYTVGGYGSTAANLANTNGFAFLQVTLLDASSPGRWGTVYRTPEATWTVERTGLDVSVAPASQQVVSGNTASFSITVTNIGEAALSGVTLASAAVPDCDTGPITLAGGAGTVIACEAAAVAEDLTNAVTVAGTPAVGPAVNASASATVTVINPSMAVTKLPASQMVVNGGDASFTVTVTNTGDVALSAVTVTDALAPDCDLGPITLASGASTSYVCTVEGVTDDFTNTVSVAADDPNDDALDPVTDTAVVDVINPAMGLTVDPASQEIASGTNATWTIVVTNSGDVALADVTVTATESDCDLVVSSLGVGASTSYVCSAVGVTNGFTNVVSVAADDPNGDPLDPVSTNGVVTIAAGYDYVVTGTLTPDATGGYVETGTYDALPYFKHATSDYWIYHQSGGFDNYVLRDAAPGEGHGFSWELAFFTGATVTGEYQPSGAPGSEGVATVSTP